MAWKYHYLRADRAEVDMGDVIDGKEVPFTDRTKCQEARDQHARFGAMCSQPIEVPDDYQLQKFDEGHY